MTKDEAIELLDCLLGMVDDNQGNDYDEAFHMAIDALKEQPEPHWIPCSERLPENDDWQIVTVCDESADRPYIYSDFGWYLEAADCWIVDADQRRDITAWMPLPEPWRGEEHETD